MVHPLAQWGSITTHFDGSGRSSAVDPEEGSVPADTLDAILEQCPSDGDLTYGIAGGFGSWTDGGDRVPLMPGWGGRSYKLFVAEKSVITQWPGRDWSWPQSANLIWPNDHSWCIAPEIDWDSTPAACADEVADLFLADEGLEALNVAFDDDLSWRGDTVNPRPAWLH